MVTKIGHEEVLELALYTSFGGISDGIFTCTCNIIELVDSVSRDGPDMPYM